MSITGDIISYNIYKLADLLHISPVEIFEWPSEIYHQTLQYFKTQTEIQNAQEQYQQYQQDLEEARREIKNG